MDEVFPTLSEIPVELAVNLQRMINLLAQANLRGGLPKYKDCRHLYQIFDKDGICRCLFKEFEDDDELSARKEASAYLLDHPRDDHRSRSSHIYGFSGVLPTVFVRFTNEENMMGVLIEFVEGVHYISEYESSIGVDAMHKMCILDVHLGNMDRNEENILVRAEEDGLRLIPIDHEMSFSNEVQNYNICSPYWIKWFRQFGGNVPFSSDCVNYVAQFDPNDDLAFLERCGWKPDSDYAEQFTVFTTFLKKAVLQGLTAHQIGLIASFKCNEPTHNLQDMVDSVEKDGNFLVNVGNRIEERLKEYYEAL